MKRFKVGDLVVVIETGKAGIIDEEDSWFCDYMIKQDNYTHEYDNHEVRLATKLDRLLLGLDNSDNAVHNESEVKT